ncbi:MAG: TlpA disulfide reductase family protein [Chitinophagaceae bacterium]
MTKKRFNRIAVVIAFGWSGCFAQSNHQSFSLTFVGNIPFDSLFLQLAQYTMFSGNGKNWAGSTQTVCKKNGTSQFTFRKNIDAPFYFSCGFEFSVEPSGRYLRSILNNYLVEPGDEITVRIKRDSSYKARFKKNDSYYTYIYENPNYIISFSGKGSAKFSCRYQADRTTSIIANEAAILNNTGALKRNLFLDKCFNTSVRVLNRYKNRLSQLAFQILYADFVGKFKADWYSLFPWEWVKPNNDSSFLFNAKKSLERRLKIEHFIPLSNKAKVLSAFYSSYIIQKEVAKAWANGNRNESVIYNYLAGNYKGELRDKLITAYLCDWYPYLKNNDSILNDALSWTQTAYCHYRLEELSNEHSNGKIAYNFALPDTSDKIIRLEDLKGKAVLIDFWYTGCTGCAQFYKTALKEVEEEYRNNNKVTFVSISVDLDKSRWIKSVYGDTYTSPAVVNLYTNGKGGEEDVIKYYKITSYPTLLLIDKQGKIFSASAADLRNKEKLKELIEEALKAE